ncbi:uncharacterized protein EKO05_0009896 [Ascochyta rabiei]|uniref:Uncharacterized protein n=1 Tax=Didymella rabiei TaxID=5454 RepID=A0A163MGP5_DIDRA|nr:uncharacterized protein EKO05_0009896 [Ascochyta rabiei]KZM28701.1 hypothetical protein ST47_g139 [Ascochyta rabiei]UPX19638.1 hypothetical protein EKO05_0009896 [Ascochyta rabiei]
MSHTFGEPYAMDKEQANERKRKRMLSRSDEEIQNDMDNKKVPYRRGWPDLQSLPLNSTDLHIENLFSRPQRDDIMARARTIFAVQRLVTDFQEITFRLPDNVNADGSTDLSAFVTFLFTADMVKDVDKVDRVIIQIRQSFMQVPAFNDISIECLHLGCLVAPPTYAVSPNDVTVRSKSEAVVDFVMQQLKKERCVWLCIEVVRRGLVEDTDRCQPTILITTPTANELRWYTTVLPGIRNFLVKKAPAFQIELLRADSLFRARKQHPPTDKVDGTSYEKIVTMGSSVGIEGDEFSGGTLGGVVTLEGGGQPTVRCGITNWHVVRDSRLDKHKTLFQKPQYMLSPSTQDHQGYLGHFQARMKNYAKNSEQGDCSAQALWKNANTQHNNIAKIDRTIGFVHTASGFRSMTTPRYATDSMTGSNDNDKVKNQLRFSLDWALIAVASSTDRVLLNVLPDKNLLVNSDNEVNGSFICNQWSTFNVNKNMVKVAKVGRTSGWTFGHINSELIHISPDNPEFQEMASLYGSTAGDPCHCFGVISDPRTTLFMEPGDSGSILLHPDSGAWLGLLFGTTGSGHGMFIAIDRIFQDIKAITGQEVTAPSFTRPEKIGLAPYQLEPTD